MAREVIAIADGGVFLFRRSDSRYGTAWLLQLMPYYELLLCELAGVVARERQLS
jgi:hypothetical protein